MGLNVHGVGLTGSPLYLMRSMAQQLPLKPRNKIRRSTSMTVIHRCEEMCCSKCIGSGLYREARMKFFQDGPIIQLRPVANHSGEGVVGSSLEMSTVLLSG